MLPNTQLDLDDLRVIHAVTATKGATRAAGLLALSQSAVSHRLRWVEACAYQPVAARVG